MTWDDIEVVMIAEVPGGNFRMTIRHKETGIEVTGEDRSKYVLRNSLPQDLAKKVQRFLDDQAGYQ